MLKLSHRALIIISGIVWFVIGFYLLNLGLNLIATADPAAQEGYPLLNRLASLFGGIAEAGIAVIAVGLLIGYFKGRYVLGKSARKGVERIATFPNPTSLANIYSKKYYILLGSMIALGISIKLFGLPNDVRGMVDIAIGAALINGAVVYFRLAALQTSSN